MNFFGCVRSFLTDLLTHNEISSCHTKVIFQEVYQKLNVDFFSHRKLPVKINSIKKKVTFTTPKISQRFLSKIDKSEKLLLKLEDGYFVESVIIPVAKNVVGRLFFLQLIHINSINS